MQLLTYIELNAFAIVILFLIFLNIKYQSERYLLDQKLFCLLLISNALILIMDTVLWILNGKSGAYMRQANLLLTVFYYILNPLPCILWSLYVDYKFYRDKKHTKRLILPFSIPILINAVLSVLSYFKGYEFFFDEKNIYHRGKLFIIMAGICFFYLLYTMIFIILKRHSIKKDYFISILMFIFLPLAGGIIQSLFYGISLVWVCMTVSILNIFINIQNNQLCTDYLTGICNRRQLDYYLKEQIKNNTGRKFLGGIMIDVNSFKSINDFYGHVMGDEALEYTAQILKKSFRKEDFIARYGGDEFIVIIRIDERAELENAVNRLQKNVEQFNERKITPYIISIGIGYDIFNPKMTMQQFLEHIDSLMYEDKKNKKSLENQKTTEDD